MSKLYFWLRFNKTHNEFQISRGHCTETKSDEGKCLSVLKDTHFSSRVEMGEEIVLYLVSIIQKYSPLDSKDKILKYYNPECDLDELSEEDKRLITEEEVIRFNMPKSMDDFSDDEDLDYITTNFDPKLSHSFVFGIQDRTDYLFEIHLNYCNMGKCNNPLKGYFYISHPFILLRQ